MSKPALRDMLLYLISRSKRTILPPAAKAIQVSVSVKIMGSRAYTYLVGIGVTHSIAPPMHNYIAKSLGYDWEFRAQECPSVEHAINLFRQPTFAGGVVTMPYKRTIMDHLDGLDEYATKL